MPTPRRLVGAVTAALLSVLTVATAAHAAVPPPGGADAFAGDTRLQALAAASTDPCVAGGPTAADAAAATSLNAVLTGSLRNAMDAYRVSCARAVIQATQARGLDERAAVIAITTTIVESTIRNTNETIDHDSLGLFQQRAGWGSAANRLNPTWATNAFLDKMIRIFPNNSWRTAAIGEVCQQVQVSGFPERYQPQAADAQRIVDALGGPPNITVSVYGVLNDGRLTYTTINSITGNRTKTVVSTAKLPFIPKTLATLNFNTLLVTSADGVLYRVDISTNSTSLLFGVPVLIEGGWTHELLAYDGHGHLYGVAGDLLISYVVSRDKPGADQIGLRHEIGHGYALKTLTATGDDWLLGVDTSGALRSYHVDAGYQATAATIADRWGIFTELTSPGYGLYYGLNDVGGLYHYLDHNPYDLNGADLQYFGSDPVDTAGWTQYLLSAQPVG
jgi:hypothetical protein